MIPRKKRLRLDDPFVAAWVGATLVTLALHAVGGAFAMASGPGEAFAMAMMYGVGQLAAQGTIARLVFALKRA